MTGTFEPLYSIPDTLFEVYRGREVIVRTSTAAKVVQQLSEEDLEKVAYLRLLDAREEFEPLMSWAEGFPLQVVLQDAVRDLPCLYACARLASKHPVQVVIPVEAGFSASVRVATALKLAVKLEIWQPEPEMIEEIREVLDYYLHGNTCTEAIDFFHSLLLSFYRDDDQTLWSIQGDDPEFVKFVARDGCIKAPREKPVNIVLRGRSTSAGAFTTRIDAVEAECVECPFRMRCQGYFKSPTAGYDCTGIKKVFQTLSDAAMELRRDQERYATTREANV